MGRGDRKTRKGKIAIRSYGNVRPHAEKSSDKPVASTPARKSASTAAKPAVKKAAVKKAAVKKSA